MCWASAAVVVVALSLVVAMVEVVEYSIVEQLVSAAGAVKPKEGLGTTALGIAKPIHESLP